MGDKAARGEIEAGRMGADAKEDSSTRSGEARTRTFTRGVVAARRRGSTKARPLLG